MTNEEQIIETIDEQGNIIKFELFDVVEVDEQEYALLLPVGEESEENELVLMRLRKEGEDYLFETIDDDAEFEKVAAYVENLEEDEEEDEE